MKLLTTALNACTVSTVLSQIILCNGTVLAPRVCLSTPSVAKSMAWLGGALLTLIEPLHHVVRRTLKVLRTLASHLQQCFFSGVAPKNLLRGVKPVHAPCCVEKGMKCTD